MKFCQDIVEKATKLLLDNELPYSNTIIIGDNASGKSAILKSVLLNSNTRTAYFVDAVNRTFNVNKVTSPINKIMYSKSILKKRLADENFNLRDSWSYYGTETECIELIYPHYMDRLQKLFKEFTGSYFEIVTVESQDVKYESGDIGKISSGYQAIARILLELLYFNDTKPKNAGKNPLVVIDEIDEYLSPSNSGKFYLFIQEKFVDIDFILSTHSAEIIAVASKCNLLVLRESGLEVLDAGDYKDIDDAMIIFKDVFGRQETTVNNYDLILKQLFHNRIAGVWEEDEKMKFNNIKETDLTAAQKVLYRQIKEW